MKPQKMVQNMMFFIFFSIVGIGMECQSSPLGLVAVDLFEEMQPMVEFMIGLQVMVIDDQGNEGEKCWMIGSLNQTCQVFTEPLWRASVVAQAKVGRVACWTV